MAGRQTCCVILSARPALPLSLSLSRLKGCVRIWPMLQHWAAIVQLAGRREFQFDCFEITILALSRLSLPHDGGHKSEDAAAAVSIGFKQDVSPKKQAFQFVDRTCAIDA